MKHEMVTDVQTVKDLYHMAYDQYEESKESEKMIRDMYHGKHHTAEELADLEYRGQPPETFNVIKLFANLMVGYYSTVVNTIKVSPQQKSDKPTAMLLDDIVQYTFESNNFDSIGDDIKLDGVLSGIMCVYEDVIDTGKVDDFGRPIRRIELSHVPTNEIVLDPNSSKADYSDAEHIHRHKWVTKNYLRKLLLKEHSKPKTDEIMDRLEAYDNHVNEQDTEFTEHHKGRQTGYFKQFENYLLVHSVIVETADNGKDKTWSIHWVADEIISKKEITYRDVKFPYRIQKVYNFDGSNYYGIFSDVWATQKAINQALLKIQLLANSEKVLFEEGAVEDADEFSAQIRRVNSVIPVQILSKIMIHKSNADVQAQYKLVEQGIDRIKTTLGLTDAFLGEAFASNSGRKNKQESSATVLKLRYLTTRVEQFYKLLGTDIVKLVRQFYTASEAIKIADEETGDYWVDLNKPAMQYTGEDDEVTGEPIMDFIYEELEDPDTGKPMRDKDGRYITAPVPRFDTEIAFSEVDVKIKPAAYDDDGETNQMIIENILHGTVGGMMGNINPAGYFHMAGLSIASLNTKDSGKIAEIFKETAKMVANEQKKPEHQQMIMEQMIAAQAQGQLGQSQLLQGSIKGPRTRVPGIPSVDNKGA